MKPLNFILTFKLFLLKYVAELRSIILVSLCIKPYDVYSNFNSSKIVIIFSLSSISYSILNYPYVSVKVSFNYLYKPNELSLFLSYNFPEILTF